MRDLNRQYDLANWSGKTLSGEDAALIEIAVLAAIADSHFGIFQRDLVAACASVGWQHDHPMTLWTVALYTNIFPVCEMPLEVRRSDGLIHFAGPSVALEQSALDLFWNDRDLVCLALKRADAPGYPVRPTGRRPGLWTCRGLMPLL